MAAAQHEPDRVYRGMTRVELDRAYNNSEAVADSQSRLSSWAERSRQFRDQHPGHLDLRYGNRERNTIDIYHCGASNAPLLVFIHGGYWQRNNKDMFACLASGPLAAGFDVAMIGYTLCPQTSLSGLVSEIETALDWLREQAANVKICFDTLIVSGWSAGAHLAALMTARDDVSAGLLISGIYDLEPCRLCYLNENLQLSDDEVNRLSPMRLGGDRNVALAVVYGSQELPELQRQSEEYVSRCRQFSSRSSLTALPRDHFSILSGLESDDGELVAILSDLRSR